MDTGTAQKQSLLSHWWFWVGVLLLAAGALWLKLNLDYNGRWIEEYGAQNLSVRAMYDEYARRDAAREEAYRNDTYGGKTPEETWSMFVAALEAGDTDLAAKYFIWEKQNEMAQNFEIGTQSGAVRSFLEEDIPLITGSEMYPNGKMFEFYTDSVDGGPGFVYVLVLNEQAGIWKIKDL